MQAQRQQHEKANPRLAKAVGRGEGERGGAGGRRREGVGDRRSAGNCHCCFSLSRHCCLLPSSAHPLGAHNSTPNLPACLPGLPAEDPLAILRDEDEADSDEEWRGIKERAAARQVVKTTAPQVGAAVLSDARCGCRHLLRLGGCSGCHAALILSLVALRLAPHPSSSCCSNSSNSGSSSRASSRAAGGAVAAGGMRRRGRRRTMQRRMRRWGLANRIR